MCLNLPPAARPACAAAAAAGRDEALQLCGEQTAARKRVCAQLGEAPYHPAIRPTQFVDPELIGGPVAPNPFFPIVAGTTWVYQGGGEDITVTVTGATRTILGVTCRVVRDVVEVGGTLVEDTEDWYAQDVDGNVWYFGELSQNFAAGRLDSLDGSWEAGVDGAKPGLVMAAAPAAGALYRQEFALGTAEDLARVLRTTASASVPAAACSGTCVKTFDFTPLEPDAREFKFYAPGVGLILEVDPETGQRVELVGVTP